MKNPYLVQRLLEPKELPPEWLKEPARNLVEFYSKEKTPETRKDFAKEIGILNNLIPCDYMGAAEFEWGSVGNALGEICRERDEFETFRLTIEGIPFNSTAPRKEKKRRVVVMGFCKKGDRNDVETFLRSEAAREGKYRLKELTLLQEGLFGDLKHEYFARSLGWLDIDNYWFATKNEIQFKGLTFLLGIDRKNFEK